jgi:hypothetical protein
MFSSLSKKKHSLKHSSSTLSSASSSSSHSARAHISGPTSVSINGSAIGKNPQQQTNGIHNPLSHHYFTSPDSAAAMFAAQDGATSIQPVVTAASLSTASTTSSASSRVPTRSGTVDLKPSLTATSVNSNTTVNNINGHRLMHSPSTSSLSSNTSSLSSFSSQKVIDQVRALHSYSSEKAHSLSFQKGDVLRVLLKLESGWWDGVNAQGQRGWFPSNYTIPIPFEKSAHPVFESSPLSVAGVEQNIMGQVVIKNSEFDTTTMCTSSSKSDYLESKSLSSGLDSTNDYKYVEITLDSVKGNPELSNTNWIPQTNSAGKLLYFNPTLKAYASSLPFDNAANGVAERQVEPTFVSVPYHFLSVIYCILTLFFFFFQEFRQFQIVARNLVQTRALCNHTAIQVITKRLCIYFISP